LKNKKNFVFWFLFFCLFLQFLIKILAREKTIEQEQQQLYKIIHVHESEHGKLCWWFWCSIVKLFWQLRFFYGMKHYGRFQQQQCGFASWEPFIFIYFSLYSWTFPPITFIINSKFDFRFLKFFFLDEKKKKKKKKKKFFFN